MKSMNIRRERLVLERRVLLVSISITITIAAIILGSFFVSVQKVNASEIANHHKYYTSIQVEAGDSLWSIADNYMSDDYANKTEYIKEVAEINHLTSDQEIHADQYLMIPYFSDETL